MKKFILIPILLLLLCLGGCSPLRPDLPTNQEIEQPLVYSNQYVVSAKGPWQPWGPSISGPTPVMPPGTFLVDDQGLVVPFWELQAQGENIEPYDPDKDACKVFSGREVDCSPNWVLHAHTNDPMYDQLWGLHGQEGIRAQQAWSVTSKSSVPVFVIDTGINCDHEDLNCVAGFNAITGQEGLDEQRDDNGHGTHVAGSACGNGNNNIGITGVAWSCPLVGIKFLAANGGGSTYNAIKGINWAIDYANRNGGPGVINASWGGGGYSEPLRSAIEKANSANLLFVAAAGNSGVNNDTNPHFPSSYSSPNIVSVGSTREDGRVSSFSNYGKASVDVLAPGSKILSASHTGGYKFLSGTSMATPHVAGLASLIWERAKFLTPPGVKTAIETTVATSDEYSQIIKSGRVDASKALATEPDKCQRKKWAKCRKNCRWHLCRFKKQLECRRDCREKFNCNPEELSEALAEL